MAARLAALAEPERRRRLVHEIAGRRRLLPARRPRQGRTACGRSTVPTSTTSPPSDTSVAARGGRSRRAGHGGAGRPAHRRGRQRHGLRAVLQLQLRRPVDDLRGHAAPAHPDGAVRRRRPLRRDLRRRHAHVHAHPLGPRPAARSQAPARARRPPPDAADRRAVRPPRPRPRGTRHARRPQRHRLRRAHLRSAAHGLRPARRRSPPGAARQGYAATFVPACRPSPTTSSPASSPVASSAARRAPRRRRCPSTRRRPCSSTAPTTRRPASGPLPRRRAAWPRSGGRRRTPGCSPMR